MQHIAIMKKEWRLIEKILSGEKILETRWYKNKYAPWDKIKNGEMIYFKDSGKGVSVKAIIKRVQQYEIRDEKQRNDIIEKVWKDDLGERGDKNILENYSKGKRYCIVIYFYKAEEVKSFNINKKGFGNMASWICLHNINKVKI